MKTTVGYKILLGLFLASGLSSCSLDEWNPSTVDVETAYKYQDGYESLINYCYDGMYYFYGKIDGIGAMEMGTDLWINVGNNETGFTLYNSNMSADLGTLRVFWRGMYATINYCNTAIFYADQVEGFNSEEARNAKVAEAYFLRGWANWHLVEQFGGVSLTTLPLTETGAINNPERSTEEEFYDLIISDLEFAAEHLPDVNNNERGRVTKKAALAMLAKAYLQRTRLGDVEKNAEKALNAAEELINNASKYGVGLYESDDEQSGFAKLWDGKNNKNNKEFLFLQAIDEIEGRNPENWNRGRTRQYYLMDTRTTAAPWGTQENETWSGRSNSRNFKPTKYLLTELFEPVADPADTRFKETFFYEYYNSKWEDVTISQSMVQQYNKNPNLVGHVIKNTADGDQTLVQGGLSSWRMGVVNMVDEDGDGWLDGLSVLTPNWVMSDEEKRDLPFWIVDPSDWFQADGRWVEPETNQMATYTREVYPSMKKFSSWEFVMDRQQWLGDIPIIRLGDVYLMAAEAALLYNGDKQKAQTYINAVRKRAAISSRAQEMEISADQATLDFILEERGRELAGEQTRWYDLKRMGKLTSNYLNATNPDIQFFDENKHIVRPIPQSFLDAISNPEEFGQNAGY
ncbi:MAG TPA: RagB/SusD family nutrient uptake outer membrane protein [Candidatus Sphingobacterium stercoripullorum]|uniref:RagB/SusD family nutrient uptake outer membrane protein n=1 Tax=Candidatus Sphingobacterium stercoripullorum TaxID=2838759 RepID=A0A9D1W8K5_9SPHI|nr:RagB/SusD family nutrient uptake outer membrane protein [Candidatus Sphingobacterium stercoripullorum]HLR50711.1 RagB/SusD family nutrient uptake outer membrane protein [Candidatus Sphingobacterium stercoripullorum]